MEVRTVRDRVRSTAAWLSVLAGLTIPGCSLSRSVIPGHLNRGSLPRSSLIFCDIENMSVPPHCATPTEVSVGIPLAAAAVALTKGQSNNIGLDFSPATTSALGCAPGQPVAITFRGAFPDGAPLCVNWGDYVHSYPTNSAACTARCKDLTPGGDAFCELSDHAHVSTNFSDYDRFQDACRNEGVVRTDFIDPRRTPEPLSSWLWNVGVSLSGPSRNTLTRTAPDTGLFDAGTTSSSLFVIGRGDGYVEFTTIETDKTRICGLAPWPSTVSRTPTPADISYGIRAEFDGTVHISESGADLGAVRTYASGDRLRVRVSDHFDGTGTITYALIPAACSGPSCIETVLRTVNGAAYPFQVDASFDQQGGTLSDVRIVRIQ